MKIVATKGMFITTSLRTAPNRQRVVAGECLRIDFSQSQFLSPSGLLRPLAVQFFRLTF
jgi:hypothetical protein